MLVHLEAPKEVQEKSQDYTKDWRTGTFKHEQKVPLDSYKPVLFCLMITP